VIDTPGLRSLGMFEAGQGLARTFADIDALAARCRFDDCAHRSEPGCQVLAALADGTLPQRRWESYVQLTKETAAMAARRQVRRQRRRKDRG
jgi:ribosome biogenesis GTPase